MAYITGTATGADDLYSKMLAFVQAHGWELIDSATKTIDFETTVQCAQLKGVGLAGSDNIYVHIIYRKQTTQDIFAFELEGSAGWLPSSDVTVFGQNPQNSYKDVGTTSSVIVRVPLHRNPIRYWLTCSPRRFMGAFLHNDRWASMYCGFILPYSLPSQYPYPLYIAGSNITTNDYKTTTNGCAFGASAVMSGMIYLPDGKWYSTPLPGSAPGGGRAGSLGIWPWILEPSASSLQYRKAIVDKNGVEQYALLPQIIYSAAAVTYGTYGELDELKHVTSWGASGGDTFEYNGRLYVLVPREQSTANQHAAAMLLED